MKIAFVHDWLIGMRGGEKVLEAACELYPEADIYTLLYEPSKVSPTLSARKVRASWLNRLPGVLRYYRYLLPVLPKVIRGFDLRDYDLVISFSHCVAKGARVDGGRRPLHVSYCFTPMRYIYYQFDNYFWNGAGSWTRWAADLFRPYLMRWDQTSARSVHQFIACSENVRQRIKTTYGRESVTLYPPVDTDFYKPGTARPEKAPYYLAAGALVPYKRVDLAIEACRKLGVKLKIVGVGTEEGPLKRLARGADVEFLGWQSAEALRELYQGCEAFLFPQEEDFGIVALEAAACGRPVVAFGRGGALETVVDGKTGVLFGEQTADALAAAITKAKSLRFEPALLREHALRFGRQAFKDGLAAFVKDAGRPRTRVMQVLECGGPGGTGYQVAALCRSLDPKRFDVDLVYAVRPGSTPKAFEALASGASRYFHIPEMVREITPLSDLKAWWRLFRLFRSERPDIVHTHSSKAGFLARTAAAAAGVPRVLYSPRGYSFLQADRGPLSRALYRWLERFASCFGEIVAVSGSEAALAREVAGASKVHVVRDAYLGKAAFEPAASKPGAEVLVCASGRMDFARHPEAFARLAGRLKEAGGAARCVWIGGGDLEGPVRSLSRELRLNGSFEITGWLDHAQALERLKSADIFVHYSRWEGLPNVVLEAMALGKPVVASDIAGNCDLIRPGENGFLAGDEDELLRRTLELAKDPDLRAAMGERNRRLIREEYSLDRLIKEISEVYERS